MAIKRRVSASTKWLKVKIADFHNRVIHQYSLYSTILYDNFRIGLRQRWSSFLYLFGCTLLYFYSTIRFVVNLPTFALTLVITIHCLLLSLPCMANSGCVVSIMPSMVKCLKWDPIHENRIIVEKNGKH